jgi:hypothetical protein
MTEDGDLGLDVEAITESFTEVVPIFKRLNQEGRERLLRTIATMFGIEIYGLPSPSRPPLHGTTGFNQAEPFSSFSEDRSIPPKEFMMQKSPRTDIERVACLGYYLTHYRDTPHFKTLDLSKLNTEAAQPKFSNAARAVDNATKGGYLVLATKGNKQLSAAGELFVQALPDRGAAKSAMLNSRPRRKMKKANQSKSSED